MRASEDSSSLTCPQSPVVAEAASPAAESAVDMAGGEGSGDNSAAAPSDAAVSANTGADASDAPVAPRGNTASPECTVEERTLLPGAARALSEEALTKLLTMCLDRIMRLEEQQARGEARQSMFDTSLQTLLTQTHGLQQQKSCGEAAVEVQSENGNANSSEAHDHERSEQYHCSRETTSCHISSWSHMNRPPALGGRHKGNSHHSDDGYDAATAPATATTAFGTHAPHSADAPAPSFAESTAPAGAFAALGAGTVMEASERDDAHASHGAGAGAVSVRAPSITLTPAAGNCRHTRTASSAGANGSTNEPSVISHVRSSSSGGGRQRQCSLVTVVSPTHTSHAEVAKTHAIAASATISAGASGTPFSDMPVKDFTTAMPRTRVSLSEHYRRSATIEFHMTTGSLSRQPQLPTQTSAEEWPSCISEPLAEHVDTSPHDGPHAAPGGHPQQQPRGNPQQPRPSLTHQPPLPDQPPLPPQRLHLPPTHCNGEKRDASSSSRFATTAYRSSGSTATSSAAHVTDELDALYHELNAPHLAASSGVSTDSAAASGAEATEVPPRKVQLPFGTDNTTAINELFTQAVQTTMETTRMKDGLTTVVCSMRKERERRCRRQRRVEVAVGKLFQRIANVSSVMWRLQKTVQRLELEVSHGCTAASAGGYHHQSHRRRRRADGNESAGVCDQDKDGVIYDSDVDDGAIGWGERLCTSLAPPLSSSASLSVGCDHVVPPARSPCLSSLTTQSTTALVHNESIPSCGAAAIMRTATSMPVVDGVGNTSASPALLGTPSSQTLTAATPVTAAASGASVGSPHVVGSAGLPKIISGSSSPHSLPTSSAIINTSVSVTAATATRAATTSRTGSATSVTQSMAPSSMSALRQARLSPLRLSPPVMVDACASESRSIAVTRDSSVAPAPPITDMRFGMTRPLYASVTDDELPAPTLAEVTSTAAHGGRASARTEGANSSSSSSSKILNKGVCSGSRSSELSEGYGKPHAGKKATEPQGEEEQQQHLAPQPYPCQGVCSGPSASLPALFFTSSRCRQQERSLRRAASATLAMVAVPILISAEAQHSAASTRHPPLPRRRQIIVSPKRSPVSAFAGGRSAADAGNVSCRSSVAARRLFDALSSEHCSSAVSGATTIVGTAAGVGNKGHCSIRCTGAVNTETTTSVDPPTVSIASSVAALELASSAASPVRRMTNAMTVSQLQSTPLTCRTPRKQQRIGDNSAKTSRGWREARRPRRTLIQSAGSPTPRSKAAATDHHGDVRNHAGGMHKESEGNDRLAEKKWTGAAGTAGLHGCESLSTWCNAAISASPAHSSSDRSPRSHSRHHLPSPWPQGSPVRVETVAGGEDKVILSPVPPAGGEKMCRPSAGVHCVHGSSGSIASTPPQRLHVQLAPSRTRVTAISAGAVSPALSTSELQRVQPVVPVTVAHHPQQLLQTMRSSPKAKKWTSVQLQTSATASGTLPYMPMAASVQSASRLLCITPILLSSGMAHSASPVSSHATRSSASAGSGAGSSGAPDLGIHSGNNMNTSLAAPCAPPRTPPHAHPPNLAHRHSRDAAMQSRHAVTLYQSATALMRRTKRLPSLPVPSTSPSQSRRVTPLSALRRTKPVTPAAAAPSLPARSGYDTKVHAVATMAPTGTSQQPANSVKVSCKLTKSPSCSPLVGFDSAAATRGIVTQQQVFGSSSPVAHHPCSSPPPLPDDTSHQLQAPSSTRDRRSSRRARAGLPPPLSVESLSDAAVSVLHASSSEGKAMPMGVCKVAAKVGTGDGVGSSATPVALFAVADADGRRGCSTQRRPPEATAILGKEKNGSGRATSAVTAAATGVRPMMRTANRSCSASTADVGRDVGHGGSGDVHDGTVNGDDNYGSAPHALPRIPPREQQQQQHRRPLGDGGAAEERLIHVSFLLDANTPVSALSSVLHQNRSPLNQQHPQHARTSGSVDDARITHRATSHDSPASSSHTSTPHHAVALRHAPYVSQACHDDGGWYGVWAFQGRRADSGEGPRRRA
ncbi:hypothetical protein LtaPh_0302900 [Leishmania tarentolae]|uniref:Uncharacterized protein n=1 Tax=Leishmania tarentolae TaxID=5689 RepID=A0A640K958_LEITA|nr:hypothetical protein LtaPh_0302900 [Leishmania tarentolae]